MGGKKRVFKDVFPEHSFQVQLYITYSTNWKLFHNHSCFKVQQAVSKRALCDSHEIRMKAKRNAAETKASLNMLSL